MMRWKERDCGGGFYIHTEWWGKSRWYYAEQLDSPGGYVVNHRMRKFPYYREAAAQIDAWKAEDSQKKTT